MARDGEGAVSGVLPLVRLRSRLFGDFMVSMPYLNNGGVLARDTGVQRALMARAEELAAELGCSHLEYRFDTELDPPAAGQMPVRTDKVAMELSLPDDEDTLGKSLGSKLRSQIRRPTKAGAVAESGHEELLDDFYAVFSKNMRDLGTPVYARAFFAAILRAFPDDTQLVVVKVDGVPAAGGFLIGHQGRLEIPWASADREFNRISVNMLLYWEVLRYAIGKRYALFDFGRSTADSGTYKFKRQWGAQPRQLWWYYWLRAGQPMPSLTPTSGKFALAVKAWQQLPLPVANLLGPHIVKNLP